MTVSPAGVYIHQSYGPRGYTLLQHMEEHDKEHVLHTSDSSIKFLLSSDDGDLWVQRFEEFAADLGGVWTTAVNAAYKYCFDVDLVALGNMRIGSQLNVFVQVYPHVFDAKLVRSNLSLLPLPDDGEKIPCLDGAEAKLTRPHPKHVPDGGVKHYYVPVVLRCGSCGANDGSNKACAVCKKVYYCNKTCQTRDWKLRHKKVCKKLKTST